MIASKIRSAVLALSTMVALTFAGCKHCQQDGCCDSCGGVGNSVISPMSTPMSDPKESAPPVEEKKPEPGDKKAATAFRPLDVEDE